MKKNIVVIGGGTQLQIVIDIIEKQNTYKIVGVIDSIKDVGTTLFGYPVIGKQENICRLSKDFDFIGGIITIGDNYTRKLISKQVDTLLPDFEWINAIHPSVIFGNGSSLGCGIVIMAGVIVNPGAILGNFSHYYTGAQIEHDCQIGKYASISAGTVLGGCVTIGDLSAVTLNCTIFDRITVGTNSVIGSGSLVTKNVPDNVLAYGNPSKIIRKRNHGVKFLK